MSKVILDINSRRADVSLPQELICDEAWNCSGWKAAYHRLIGKVRAGQTIVRVEVIRK